MKIKTSELQGAALDWAVAKCIGFKAGESDISIKDGMVIIRSLRNPWGYWKPSTDWSQGGPIIDRERIAVDCFESYPSWRALPAGYYGPTPLIAAMRCYVASKLGDAIEIPGGLL